MAAVTLSGTDTIIINTYTLVNLADGNCGNLTFPNKIANAKIGKDGNALIAQNQTGKLAELELRILRGSPDDVFLNGLLNAQVTSFVAFPLLIGQVVKHLSSNSIVGGISTNQSISDAYSLSGGYFSSLVPVIVNPEGDTGQAVSVYKLEWVSALVTVPRTISS
jgi:hypothetical protein